MKRRMRLALWLYPPAWRERYAREFTALLEDVDPGWREFWDVARGGWALRIPDAYVSTAVIRIADGANVRDLQRAQTQVLSRGSLAELIVQDNLFYDERMKIPMEDVIADVQNKHIRIVPLATTQSGN